MSPQQVFKWFCHFKVGQMSVKDYKHPELCLTGRRNQLVAQVNHVV
jgi:hypothetical protein